MLSCVLNLQSKLRHPGIVITEFFYVRQRARSRPLGPLKPKTRNFKLSARTDQCSLPSFGLAAARPKPPSRLRRGTGHRSIRYAADHGLASKS